MKSGLDGLLDYEIIELLLTLGTPMKDCKQQAKAVIAEFKTLNGVLNADNDELEKINGIGPSNSFGIKLFRSLILKYNKEKVKPVEIINSPYVLYDFLKEKIGKEKKEHFVILFLDSRNNLNVEDVSIGTLDASIANPRDVFQKAIAKNAANVIIAHNHPSGDTRPSEEDVTTTERLIEAGKIIGIHIIDHIIVSGIETSSLKEFGVRFT